MVFSLRCRGRVGAGEERVWLGIQVGEDFELDCSYQQN